MSDGGPGQAGSPNQVTSHVLAADCWDGHDNAQRAEETGVGRHISRDGWSDDDRENAILGLMADDEMRFRLKENAATMARTPGTDAAAAAILALIRT